jgi:hypothetical protein
MKTRRRNLIVLTVIAIFIIIYFAWPRSPELPPGILGQRLKTLLDQGYDVVETNYETFLDYMNNPIYEYTEYREPNNWSEFRFKLDAAMIAIPEYVTINYVYNPNLVQGAVIYFRIDTDIVHDLNAYWID